MRHEAFWRGRRVFLTGHTGFKGGWLALMLARAGALVHGYALAPPTEPNLFTAAGVQAALASHVVGDVRDAAALSRALHRADPEVVFHLAAQPLVRSSYLAPAETFSVNVQGTVHLLDAARDSPGVRAIVNVTSDKCYANDGSARARREDDALGGHDPYSSSKAASELVTAAYRDSYFAARNVGVATARAGNVIGGGDWAEDRLVPDFFRALDAGRPLPVRHPDAVRPWQHVLEPLTGYLLLAEALHAEPSRFAGAWNFGPDATDARPVAWLLDRLATDHRTASWQREPGEHPHEASMLLLDSTKAQTQLGWQPRTALAEALQRTAEWHAAWHRGDDLRALTEAQIEAHALPDAQRAAA